MIYDLLDLYDVKSGMGNKSRNDFDPNKYENHIVMFKEIFNNSKLPDKNKLSTTVNLKQGELERFDVKFGDVLLTSSSETPNELAMSSVALRDYPNTVYSGFSKRLRPITHLTNPQYMRYWFRSRQFRDYIDSTVSMTTRANLNMAILSAIKIDLPDLNTQKAIANILSSLDDKIELNNKINKNLEELAQTLYKQWFVDFEFPNGDGEPYKSSGGVMVESELGLIPKGWEVKELSDVALVSSGKRPPIKVEEKTKEYKYPVIGASRVMAYTQEYNIDEKILIIGRVGTHGIVQRITEKVWASDNTLTIKSNVYEFVYQILNQIDYKSLNRGSTQPLITQTDINKTEILVPKSDLLEYFEKVVSSLFEVHKHNLIQNNKLSKTRDELLPKLMNGEIEVAIEE